MGNGSGNFSGFWYSNVDFNTSSYEPYHVSDGRCHNRDSATLGSNSIAGSGAEYWRDVASCHIVPFVKSNGQLSLLKGDFVV